MKDADKARNEVARLIEVVKQTQNNTADSLKETIKERTVFQEKRSQFFINCKNTVPMRTLNESRSNGGGTLLTVFHATRGTKAALACKGNEFPVVAVWACIQGSTKRGITTADHARYIFHFDVSWMESILNHFVIIFKNLLQDIHMIIMQ